VEERVGGGGVDGVREIGGGPLTLVRLASASAPPTESWAVRASRGASSAGSLLVSRLW